MEFLTFVLVWTALFMATVVFTPILFAPMVNEGPTTFRGRWGRRLLLVSWLAVLATQIFCLGWMTVVSGAAVDGTIASVPLFPLASAGVCWLVQRGQPTSPNVLPFG